MKLLNYTLLSLSGILFGTVSLWAVLFDFQLLNQFKNTVDEGLANYKIILIDKLKNDSLVSEKSVFLENIYIIKSVSEKYALQVRDSYKDTLIFSGIKNKNYQTRLLTTAFLATNGRFYEMKVISQEVDKSKLIKELAISLLSMFLFLLVTTLFVNNFVLKKTWKPFYELLDFLNLFRLERITLQPPKESKITEFSLLNKSIQKLIKTNSDIFYSQKQFIENASHELQTPLAIGINKLELLAGEEDLSPEQIQKIGNIIESLQRLSNLNKSLLLLSKIENKQFVSEEQVSLDSIVKRLIEDFLDFSEYRKIEIKYVCEEPWIVKINKDLAIILAMNLLKNAIIHNKQDGIVEIKFTVSSFTIENTSNEPPMAFDKLFDRFNKTNKNKNSTGLGLAIVKAITDLYGLSVTYSYNGRHVFKVSIPDSFQIRFISLQALNMKHAC